MKRTPGCFSVYGTLAALIVAIGIVGWTLLRGPTLFSPGPLTAVQEGTTSSQGYTSHAEMEPKCTLCHQPWQRVETARCLACHRAVENEISGGTGIHGRLDNLEVCAACHPDHLGREADIARTALDRYPHDQIGFSLSQHQQLVDGTAFVCTDCHVPGGYVLARTTCIACHRGMDTTFLEQHVADYGAGCLSCHDGRTMPDDFDHGTVFLLDSAHTGVACDTCHIPDAVTRPSEDCVDCHDEPAIHQGGFGTNCAACHTVDNWLPAHLRVHAFSLNHGIQAGEEETFCLTCHPDSYVAYNCYGCHEHQQDKIERVHNANGMTKIGDCARCHPTEPEEERESR